MWRAFWANCSMHRLREVPLQQRLKLLDRSVLPVFDYRCSRWPPAATLEGRIDTCQRRMVGLLMRVPRHAGEEAPDYFRRRAREAKDLCRQRRWWSHRHCFRVLDWRAHLERPRNSRSWAAQLLHWQGERWLQGRRAQLNSYSLHAGRTDTRLAARRPRQRWHDGARYALEHMLPGSYAVVYPNSLLPSPSVGRGPRQS